jgi:hypothetical protein
MSGPNHPSVQVAASQFLCPHEEWSRPEPGGLLTHHHGLRGWQGPWGWPALGGGKRCPRPCPAGPQLGQDAFPTSLWLPQLQPPNSCLGPDAGLQGLCCCLLQRQGHCLRPRCKDHRVVGRVVARQTGPSARQHPAGPAISGLESLLPRALAPTGLHHSVGSWRLQSSRVP